MSCISQILKLKGDQKALIPLGENNQPWIAVEGGGKYKDYEYLIVLNSNGNRCGYVAIPPGHKYDSTPLEDRKVEFQNYKREYKHYDYDKLDIECHGGLTFMSRHHDLKDLLPQSCDDFWIGFDCGHCWDKPDIAAMTEYYGEQYVEERKRFLDVMSSYAEDFRNYDYVEEQCHRISEQLIERAA